MCFSGLSKLIFNLLRGRVIEGNCHLCLWSTTLDNILSPWHSSNVLWCNEWAKNNVLNYNNGQLDILEQTWTLGVSSTVLFFLWEINRFLNPFEFLHIWKSLVSQSLGLYPRMFWASRLENRGSSFECQLTFEL